MDRQQALESIEHGGGHFRLRHQRQRLDPLARHERHAIRLNIKSRSRLRDVVGDDEIDVFRLELP